MKPIAHTISKMMDKILLNVPKVNDHPYRGRVIISKKFEAECIRRSEIVHCLNALGIVANEQISSLKGIFTRAL